MKTLLAILFVLSTSTFATADALRLKVRPISGELVESAHPCSKETRMGVWKIVFKAPFVSVIDGVMTAAVGERARAADRVIDGDGEFVGFFDQGDGTTISVSVSRVKRVEMSGMPARFKVTEISIIRDENTKTACYEKWLGLAELL